MLAALEYLYASLWWSIVGLIVGYCLGYIHATWKRND